MKKQKKNKTRYELEAEAAVERMRANAAKTAVVTLNGVVKATINAVYVHNEPEATHRNVLRLLEELKEPNK